MAQRDPDYNKDLNPGKKEQGSGGNKLMDIFRKSTTKPGNSVND